MSARFRRMSADDLLTYHVDVVMRPHGDVMSVEQGKSGMQAPI